jgi:hypothetical protein
MKTYIQSLGPGAECDVCGYQAVAEVRNLITDEVITTLCEEHLEGEGWLG